ncbi:MAG: thioredoxin domain-containing protein [Planctomycetota bacterium]
MRRSAVATLIQFLFFLCLFSGCAETEDNTPVLFARPALPEVSGAELASYVADSQRPVLVEFGVDYNCGRCESMKPDVLQLAEKYKTGASVVRVNFTANVDLVTELGGNVCPTYVLYNQGEPVMVRSHPTSYDLLESDLLNLLPDDRNE